MIYCPLSAWSNIPFDVRSFEESSELAQTGDERVPDLLADDLPVPAVAHDVRLPRLALNQRLLRLLR